MHAVIYCELRMCSAQLVINCTSCSIYSTATNLRYNSHHEAAQNKAKEAFVHSRSWFFMRCEESQLIKIMSPSLAATPTLCNARAIFKLGRKQSARTAHAHEHLESWPKVKREKAGVLCTQDASMNCDMQEGGREG